MPNTPIRRMKNCCMPPKKSAWRFEDSKLPAHSLSEPVEINYQNMGLMINNEMKSVDHIQYYPSKEALSHMKNEQFEETPLDFSVKKDNNRTPESLHQSMKSVSYELKEDSLVYPGKIINGNNNQFPPQIDSPPMLETSRASSSKDSDDSYELDCSQESIKSPSHTMNSSLKNLNEMCRINSTDHINSFVENCPDNQPSILAEMLKGHQQSNNRIPNGPQSFFTGFRNGLGVIENSMIASPSPPIGMNAPVMNPTNMLNLSMTPYIGYGLVEPANHFMPGYMYKSQEQNMIDISAVRKTKRRMDPLTDSLRLCSIDELQKRLYSLSGGRSITNPENSKSYHMAPRKHFSNNVSPETVISSSNGVHENSTIMASENGEKDKVSESTNNETNTVNNTTENDKIAVDINLNESNSHDTMNGDEKNIINNTKNIPCVEEHDSMQSAITQSSPGGRKRKPVEDYKNDPQYRLKRAKNNAAARRSRESRRIKEELIRKTATALEQQNKVILHDLGTLKFAFDDINVKYISLLKEYENMKIQNSVLVERLNQKRCGQCGSTFPNVK